jgi:hypothetical protein
VELHIANVHNGSDPSMVLYNLRMAYKREVAASRKRPFSSLEDTPNDDSDAADQSSAQQQLQLQTQHLSPEDAVLDVDMSAPRKQWSSHAGWGYVTVANRSVAELLMQASAKNALNCAPPTKSLLRREFHRNAVLSYGNIRNNPRDVAKAKVSLPASGFGVVEVMHSSGSLSNGADGDLQESAAELRERSKVHKYSVLWEASIDEVIP